jgi:hypothetical protein
MAAARRAVMLVLAAMAWVENMATAISAADKNVTLVICFLHMVREAEEARLLHVKCTRAVVSKGNICSRAIKDVRAA